jgi:hypothetical protein
MPEAGRALREASDALLRDLEALSVLEEEKREVTPGDPRLIDLAAQIEAIAARVLITSARQHELTEQIQEAAENGSASAPIASIDDTPRAISAILNEWRDAERRLEAASPGTAEAREAEVIVERLRDEYRKSHEAATRNKGS